MKTLEQITEILENLDDNKLFDIWNEYTTEIANNGGAMVFNFNDDFFSEYLSDPAEAARATFFGDVKSWSDEYVIFNGYGNLETSNYLTELISVYDLASHIADNQNDYTDLLDG